MSEWAAKMEARLTALEEAVKSSQRPSMSKGDDRHGDRRSDRISRERFEIPLAENPGAVAIHEAAADPHPGYLTQAEGDALYGPIGAEYVVGATNAALTGERVGTTTATIEWDFGTAAQAKLNVVNDSITFAKMQNIATDRLLGRDTASSGDPEELTVGGGLEFSGSGGVQRSALTGDVTALAASGSTTIANNAVTFAKMQAVSADVLLGNDSSGTAVEEIACTAAGRALLDDASASAQRTTLGLGTAATAASTDFAPSMLFITVAADTNAVSNRVYHVDSSGGVITMTLPASPAAGDQIIIKREGGSNVTIARNGKEIEGAAADYTLTATLQSVDLRYESATGSWWAV